MHNYHSRIVTAPIPGGPEALRLETRSLNESSADEVLIDVAACGVNRPDIFERMGLYPSPQGAPEGLGLEVSGTIKQAGANSGFAFGEQVVALVSGGGYSDIARAHFGSVLPAPNNLTLIDAAALPETVFTVWVNVFQRGGLKPDERFLVHGGASGIGTTAIQMAKAYGAYVVATAGTDEKCELCQTLGADRVFNYKKDDWVNIIKSEGGSDVILDMVGGDYVAKNLSVLNIDGRLSMIAFLKGSRVDLDLMMMMLKRQTLTGSTLRSRSHLDKAEIARQVRDQVWPWIVSGQFRPIIDSRFKLNDVAKAHERMDSMAHAGKILLIP